MSNISLRTFIPNDTNIQKYLEIEKTIDTPYAEVTTSAEEAKAELQKTTANFIFSDEDLVGFVAYQTRTEGSEMYGYIWEIVLLPEFRERGIGEIVIRKVLELNKSFPRVCLQVDPENIPARSLYEKLGFKIQERIENATDAGRPRLRMCYFNT